ncbi:MAG: response regulator [Spongiibacteraceae bacterium]
MRSLLALTLTLLFVLNPANASTEALIVSPELSKLPLDSHLLYLYDQQQTHHLGQVSDTDMSRNLKWHKGSERENSLLMPPGLYWFKGELRNPSPNAISITLETEYPSINVADLYVIDNDNKIQTIYTGAGLNAPFTNRPILHRNLVNELILPPRSLTTLIWRIESDPLFQFRATAWAPKVFIDQDQHQQMFYGMIYGMLLVMALYNLFLFFSTQVKSYLYYALYVFTATYLIAAEQGHIYQYIAIDHVWAKNAVHAFVYAINLIMFSQFCISFLHMRQRSHLTFKVFRVLTIIAVVASVIMAYSNSLMMIFVNFTTTTLLFVIALIAGAIARKAGSISAGHFMLAIMILGFSQVANNMATLGLIQHTHLTENLGAIGTTLMLVLFSLALADRINQLQKELKENIQSMSRANEETLKARTELHRSQVQRIKLEQTTSQARLENSSKSDFLATMSHEVRTPMNEVLNMTSLMKSTSLSDKQSEYINSINRSSQALLSIINDLQDFVTIEAGEMKLETASFNLETLLDDCISTFSAKAVEKNLNFIADLEPGIEPVLKGDSTKLRQIILNLLSNAFKFTDHGDIVLKASVTGKTAINSVELKFEISDSGIGLTAEEQRHLFTPFVHGDDSTYGRYGGSGLGLAISKQLAELMDGKIGVDSEPGKGSTFWFTARLLIDENPDTALLREKSSTLTNKRVLVVDPNPVSVDIIKRQLSNWNMDVDTCSNVTQAKQKLSEALAENQPFDALLAEYYLYNETSLAIASFIKQHNELDTPFILMASSRKLDSKSELTESGIEILLEKPITNALLHDALIQAIASPLLKHKQMEATGIDTSQLKILVAEDNQVNQLVIQSLLNKLGITPDIAANGVEAVNLYGQNDYDLIIMDCEMPEMDGYEASNRIRTKEKAAGRKRVPIIALSAHARSDFQEQALEAGMDDHLTKPITLSDLITLIKKELGQGFK